MIRVGFSAAAVPRRVLQWSQELQHCLDNPNTRKKNSEQSHDMEEKSLKSATGVSLGCFRVESKMLLTALSKFCLFYSSEPRKGTNPELDFLPSGRNITWSSSW